MFYRTEDTIINRLILLVFSPESYMQTKSFIQQQLPLRWYEIYSLPQGLWVFCITLFSKHLYIEWRHKTFKLVYLPLILAVIIEGFQYVHWTNGTFDPLDLFFSGVFWVFAHYLFKNPYPYVRVLPLDKTWKIFCVLTYALVFLGCVW